MKRFIAFLLFLFLTVSVRFANAQAWFPCDGGTFGIVLTMAADTTHNRLFVAGTFTSMDTLIVSKCAIWDGSEWSKFIHDGTQEGFNDDVGKMLVWNNYLYYNIRLSAGLSAMKRVNLTTLSTENLGNLNGGVTDMVIYHDTLYICGDFNGMMKKWTGSNWVTVTGGLGTGVGFGLFDMEVYNDKIYVVGDFEITSPDIRKDVAVYNNGVWEQAGVNSVVSLGNNSVLVFSIKGYHNKLYLGGGFGSFSGSPGQGLLVLNDSIWESTGIDFDFVQAMTVFQDKLFISSPATIPGSSLPHAYSVVIHDDTSFTIAFYGNKCPYGAVNTFESGWNKLYVGGTLMMAQDSQSFARHVGYLNPDTAICFPSAIITDGDTLTVISNGIIQWINCDNGSIISGATSNIFLPNTFGNYAAIVNDGSCIDTSACVSYTGLNGELSIANGVTLYPNPTSEKITAEWNGIANEIELTDLLGRIVLKQTVTPAERSRELNLSNLNCGIYFLTIKTVTGNKTVKVVKE